MRTLALGLALAACNGDDPVVPEPPAGRVLAGPLVGRSLAVEQVAGAARLWVGAPGIDGSGGAYGFDAAGGTLADAAAAVIGAEPGDVGEGFAPCDLDGDGAVDLLIGAPDRGDAGGAWWVPGPLDGQVDVAGAVFVAGFRADGHSGAVVSCGDLDGDSVADAAISAPDTDSDGIAIRTGTIDLHRATGSGIDKFANIDTSWSDSRLGYRTGVVAGADLDGDGVGDLAAGAGGADRVHLVFGPIQGSVYTNAAGPTLSGIEGEATGHALAAGDLDGDGAVDLVVGAPLALGARGSVWVLPGPFDPDGLDTPISRLGRRLEGVGEGDQAGFSLAVPGDVDGDGADDLLIGAPYAGGVGPEAGAVYVVHGPGDLLGDLDGADALLLGDVARGRLGWAVAGGDLDGDGSIELAVGAPEADVGDEVGVGVVYVFAGDVAGVRYPDTASARIDRGPVSESRR
jgi:hypothetical protein